MSNIILPQAATPAPISHAALFGAVDNAIRQKQQQEQEALEEYRRKFAVMQSVNPAVLSDKFETEVVNAGMENLNKDLTEIFQNADKVNSIELGLQVQQKVAKMAQYSAAVKATKESLKQQAAGLQKDRGEGFDVGDWHALALDRALYKVVDGMKVLKSPEEIDPTADYFGAIEQESPELITAGQPFMRKYIKGIEASTIGKKNADGTGFTATIPFYMEVDGKGKAILRKDKSGYVSEDVYKELMSDPNFERNFEAEARKAGGAVLGQDPEADQLFRRAYLTQWLERNAIFKQSTDNEKSRTALQIEGLIPMPGSGSGDGDKKIKPDEYTTFLRQSVSLDPSLLDGATETTIDDQTGVGNRVPAYDITPFAPSGMLKLGRVDGKTGTYVVASAVLVRPDRPGTLFVQRGGTKDPKTGEWKGGQLIAYSGEGLLKEAKKWAQVNSSTNEKVEAIVTPAAKATAPKAEAAKMDTELEKEVIRTKQDRTVNPWKYLLNK